MTKEEEAIEQLKLMKVFIGNDAENPLVKKMQSALDMGIKALEQTIWIPCSERLPEELEPVNITWVNHNPASYYADIKDKPFAATGVYFNGQWYWWSTLCTDILTEHSHNYDDIIDDAIEVIAWQPLPETYEESEGMNDT